MSTAAAEVSRLEERASLLSRAGPEYCRGSRELSLKIQKETPFEHIQEVMGALKEKALEGNVQAAKEWLDRVVGKSGTPPSRESLEFQVRRIKNPKDCLAAKNDILVAACMGWVTADEGSKLQKMVDHVRMSLETDFITRRLQNVELDVLGGVVGVDEVEWDEFEEGGNEEVEEENAAPVEE